MDASHIITTCNAIYAEANDIYTHYRAQLGDHDLGYKILYGPPHANCAVLFVGDQPGGKVVDEKLNERFGWPARCEYVTENWTLARNMQNMFGPTLLENCVGVNANFFRAPNADAWRKVRKDIRTSLQGFSIAKLMTLIELIKPKQVVTIGVATLEQFGPTEPLLQGTKNRVLMRRGKIGQWPAVSTLHLSGAQIAREDRSCIAHKIKSLVASSST